MSRPRRPRTKTTPADLDHAGPLIEEIERRLAAMRRVQRPADEAASQFGRPALTSP